MSTQVIARDKPLGPTAAAEVQIDELPVLELDAGQISKVESLARSRARSYEDLDTDEEFGHYDSITRHTVGILGEMAVAQWYNVAIDSSRYEFGDDGYDIVLWGKTVDVKTTATQKLDLPELIVRANRELTADVYFLTHVLNWSPEEARIRLIGYATAEQVRRQSPERHPGSRKNRVIVPNDLRLPPAFDFFHGA